MVQIHVCLTVYVFVWFCTLVTGGCPFDGDVKCNDTGRCLRSTYACNGYSSCRYGNDEENCGKNILQIFRRICLINWVNTHCDQIPICYWICENPLLMHTMTRHSFNCQSMALSIS